MSENLQTVTDDTFEEEVLKSDKPGVGGFLGRMVRPLPDAYPHCGRGCSGIL